MRRRPEQRPRREGPAALLERLCAASETAPGPRALVLVAHPDDEVVGAAGRLRFLPDAHIVHVTDGAPYDLRDARAAGHRTREAYAAARRQEALAALALAGIPADRVRCLGRVDQQTAFDLPGLTLDLAALFRALAPDLVLTHPYEGGHPDHDAIAFAARAALRILARDGAPCPALLELSSYHAGPRGIATSCFLPYAGHRPRVLSLDPAALLLKRRMLACHASQWRTLRWFTVAVECFRVAPPYDFTAPPHEGRLWYERYPLGMTAARWVRLARSALEDLQLDPTEGGEEAPPCPPS
ncbi:MAG TPA: PIG-L family deacetylase [Longimicrobiales bacterium]